MTRFTVLTLKQALARHQEFDAVISIENADGNYRSLNIEDGRPHLTMRFNDIDFDDGSDLVVTKHHLEEAINFYKDFLLRGEGTGVMVHCHVGRCRSPAIALMLIAIEEGKGHEKEAIQRLLDVVPSAAPNLLVLKLADELLGRNGDLIAAWEPFEHTEAVQRVRRLKREVYKRIRGLPER